eukprot:10944818-Karenia_brevis.AAC.1
MSQALLKSLSKMVDDCQVKMKRATSNMHTRLRALEKKPDQHEQKQERDDKDKLAGKRQLLSIAPGDFVIARSDKKEELNGEHGVVESYYEAKG